MRPILFLLLAAHTAAAQIPYIQAPTVEETKIPVFQSGAQKSDPLANFRLHLEYEAKAPAEIVLGEDLEVDLPAGRHAVEITHERLEGKVGIVRASIDGDVTREEKLAGPATAGGAPVFESDDKALALGGDFTTLVSFKAEGKASGTLFSKCAPGGAEWAADAKAFYLRGGKLVYDIGWLGAVSGGPKVTDGKAHVAVLVVEDGNTELFLDGRSIVKKQGFTAKDKKGFVFKIGKAASNFGGDLKNAEVANLRYWARALEGAELEALLAGKTSETNTPDLNWNPGGEEAPDLAAPAETFAGRGTKGIPTTMELRAGDGFKITEAWVQPLEAADHASLIAGWNEETLAEGKKIYTTLCMTCHGTPKQEGSIPIALKFHEGEFKNGHDPYRIFETLTKGYGLMVAQQQYTPKQRYSVIQYIREEYLKASNPKQHFAITKEYLEELPLGLETNEKAVPQDLDAKPYERMDFGPALQWTYQVNERGGGPLDWNIAQKGINIRLDAGPGGVSKGRAWIVYDEDTLRVAAAYTGRFVDWKGIAFDGSHGTHTGIAGDRLFITEDAPAWQNPEEGNWTDLRVEGRDTRRFGPLPRTWMRYKGIYYHGNETPVLRYSVGKAEILERPGYVEYGTASLFTRTLNIGKSPHDLLHRICPADKGLHVMLRSSGDGVEVVEKGGQFFLRVPAASTPANLILGISRADEATVGGLLQAPADLAELTQGGPARFGQEVIKVAGELGEDSGAFAVDTIPTPNKEANPWNSWMRLGGFDFFPENPDRAAVCTWLGDVWLVDGISGDLAEVRWRRICSGLFQPLGLKIIGGKIHVTCRDQIARLHDLNGDEEIDYVECFNGDHQVTEHFHEFAMGLQTDEKGNLYYAKSARHAKIAVVPHHGTLLRVSPDGTQTDIVANGFRAANGVCLNPDGTWIVTDQEGHWNPKNRINYVREGGFYGNMFGYHDVEDSSDEAMEQPLCWITNAFDRSPAELLWVPEGAGWGNLDGTLLNLSYGYGKIFTVPHETLAGGQAQGGMCAFPIENLPTGTHRGRFHPGNKQLYVAGMFAWAGSQQADGGFFRIRATGKPALLPTSVRARVGEYSITFSDELPEGGEFKVKVWDLKRTKSYGSKHYNERELSVEKAEITGDTVTLSIPGLEPTWGMEVRCTLGNGEERVLHNSIHELPKE